MFWGKGKMEGWVTEGTFKNGKLDKGQCKIIYPEGGLYEGMQN